MKTLFLGAWGWLRALSGRAKALVAAVLAALLGFVIWAVFFWFAFQTSVIDDEVDEAGPVFDSGAVAGAPVAEPDGPEPVPTAAVAPTPGDAGSAPTAAPPEAAAGAAEAPTAVVAPTPGDAGSAPTAPLPGDELSAELIAEMDEAMEDLGMPAEQAVTETMPEMPQVRVEAAGEFISRSHPTRGRADVLGDGTGQRFLRFEDFRTDNGPDLNVYLSTAPADAPAGQFDDDFVDLGDLKGNVGSQNYEIPRDLDLDRYSTVVVWCVRFSVVFGAAELVSG